MRDPGIVNFVIDQGVKFVTTSAGDPQKYCAALKAAGLTRNARERTLLLERARAASPPST